MAVNKVIYGGETLVDLTGDNVSESTLLNGVTAHNAAGQAIVGTVTVPTKVSQLENDSGFVKASDQIFTDLSNSISGKSSVKLVTWTSADIS